MEDMFTDEIGRCFCDKHRRAQCHECCYDFRDMNEMAEEEAGIRPKKTPAEKAAAEVAVAMSALRGMERMVPRPSQEIFQMNRQFLKDAQDKLKAIEDSGEDVKEPLRRAMQKEQQQEGEMRGLTQAYAQQNPNSRTFEVGGPETQRLYDEFMAAPETKQNRAEKFTCAYCGKSSPTKLNLCSRCKKVAYCDKDCQRAAWRAHKKECVVVEGKEPKSLPLTWPQVEAHGGSPVLGRVLQVRAMVDESVTRQVFGCKDRTGEVRRVVAYTASRRVPGLQQGVILKWKNPRYHYFADGSSGARIEEEDLVNITISND